VKISSPFDDLDKEDDSLEITSLIDVVFLLLTFFILAATFVAPSLDVSLPEASSATKAEGLETALTFSIDQDGAVYHEKNPIELENYKALLSSHAPETPLIFNVDQAAPFNAFLTLIDEAKLLNRQRFLINAQPPSDNGGGVNDELRAESSKEPAALNSQMNSQTNPQTNSQTNSRFDDAPPLSGEF
jgi:biopolymer transport protein ExbD